MKTRCKVGCSKHSCCPTAEYCNASLLLLLLHGICVHWLVMLTRHAGMAAQLLQLHAVAVWSVACAGMLVAAAVLSGATAVLQAPN
jgi:hypothetical protein